MKRDGRGVDALSIFGIALGLILLIFGPGTGF